MDFPYLNDVVEKMKFKNKGITRDSVTGKIGFPGWVEGVYDEYWSGPNMDFLGSNFAPFHHNYLYGWSIVDIVETNFRAMNEDKAARKIMMEAFADMDQKVGGSSTTPQFLTYVQDHGGHHLLLLVRAFQFSLIPFEESVYLMNVFFSIEANQLRKSNDFSMYMLPISLGVQLYALGWKRTLALWAVGVLATEGLHKQLEKREPFAGWSLIGFMTYGQMLNETFSDSKLRTVKGGIQSLRGLAINGLGGYGTYVTVWNLINDPAPFLEKSQKTGIHHGVHHLGLLGGFLMNRWSR